MKNDFNVDQIKKLWMLNLILQTGSLKGAAAKAKVTPSAVSQALASLERSVGKPLVVRERGSTTATQDALAILEIVKPAFEIFGKLHDLGSQPIPKLTWLNFGAYESLAIDILPGLLHRLRSQMPNLRLGLRVGRTRNLLTMIRKGELCSALVSESDELDRFYKVRVGEDRLGVFVSIKHPIANSGVDVVERYGLGSLAPGPEGLPRYYAKFLKKLKAEKPTLLSESFEALRVAATQGAIAAILPARVARRGNDLMEVTPAGFTHEDGRHGIYVVSQVNCDREETDFLAHQCARLL